MLDIRTQMLADIDTLEKKHGSATLRKQQCELLMRRKSATKWDAAKKAKMVRKLMKASSEIEQATQAIEYFRSKLSEEHG